VIVADTNLLSYLLIEGAHTAIARAVYRRDPLWVVPPLWRCEFLNVLTVSVRAGVISERQAGAAWKEAVALVGGAEHEPDPLTVLHLALNKGISAYDAQFVALAAALETMLVSGDRKLVRRCPDQAVLMDRFAGG